MPSLLKETKQNKTPRGETKRNAERPCVRERGTCTYFRREIIHLSALLDVCFDIDCLIFIPAANHPLLPPPRATTTDKPTSLQAPSIRKPTGVALWKWKCKCDPESKGQVGKVVGRCGV